MRLGRGGKTVVPSNVPSTSKLNPDSTGFEGRSLAKWGLGPMLRFENIRSGARAFRDDSVARAAAVRVAGGAGVGKAASFSSPTNPASRWPRRPMRTARRQTPSTTTNTPLAMGGRPLEGAPCLGFSC